MRVSALMSWQRKRHEEDMRSDVNAFAVTRLDTPRARRMELGPDTLAHFDPLRQRSAAQSEPGHPAGRPNSSPVGRRREVRSSMRSSS